jgi:hypothetical protein
MRIDPNGEEEWELNTSTGQFSRVGDKGGSETDFYNILRPNEKGEMKSVQTIEADRGKGRINSFRMEETDKSTISAFHIPEKNISGFFLEPSGPSTEKSGTDRRIPEGEYNISRYSSNKYPNSFILSNDKVSKDRKILIHAGNYPKNTEGCQLPGSTKAVDFVGDSSTKYGEIKKYLNAKNVINVQFNIFNVIPNLKK